MRPSLISALPTCSLNRKREVSLKVKPPPFLHSALKAIPCYQILGTHVRHNIFPRLQHLLFKCQGPLRLSGGVRSTTAFQSCSEVSSGCAGRQGTETQSVPAARKVTGGKLIRKPQYLIYPQETNKKYYPATMYFDFF